MVDVTADDGGSRRRLPQWMLGVSAAGQVKKSGDANEDETLGENSNVLVKCDAKRRKRKSTEQDQDYEGEVKETVPEKKRVGRGRSKVQEPAASERQISKGSGKGMQLRENESLEENSDFPAKCETKRRKSKSKDQDAEGDDNVPEAFPEKKSNGRGRRKVQESVALNRRKAKGSSCGGDVEQEDQISTDDEELTVNDLVNIAKEHIEAHRHSKLKEASNRESESGSRVAERVYSSNKLEDSVDAQNCIKRSVIPDTRSSKPNGSLTNKEIAFSSSSTGDPAQDMLDLFLGPLLRKTVEKETQTQSLAEDVAFAYDMKTESRSNAVREEIAPVTKKKSSLKDKVAMFLD